ncbi:MAG TPA: amino acid-binding protein [Phycisphaerae bacterium]|nr:amino acid-binding protein [Phycisphaerae bacterium]
MSYEITKEEVWVGTIEDRAGGLAEKLEAVSRAGVDLEFLIARRAPDEPGTGVVFMAPMRGDESVRAALQAGLTQWTSASSLRVEGPDRPGLGALITWTVANEDINVRGVSGAKLGERSVFYLAFDSAADADKAHEALTNALNR